jgi:hypothetical protein
MNQKGRSIRTFVSFLSKRLVFFEDRAMLRVIEKLLKNENNEENEFASKKIHRFN